MTDRVTTRRKNAFNMFKEGRKLGSFDEFPVLLPDVDPQLHLSHNSVDQPFHLMLEQDSVLCQAEGRSCVEFTAGPVRFFDLDTGDFVYVPGGTPHRIRTVEPGTMFRYKSRQPGREAALWHCDRCGNEVDRFIWSTGDKPSQSGFQAACEHHNAAAERRLCGRCGTAHDPVDLSHFRWSAVAEALAAAD